MQDKKQIGKKIWELFNKNYSYGEIAKELGISKSVVSNVINYSLPSEEWCNENIKELKENIKKEKVKVKKLNKKLEELDERLEELKKEELATKISSIIITFIITFIVFIIDTKLLQNLPNPIVIRFVILVISLIVVFVISFFLTNLSKKLLL